MEEVRALFIGRRFFEMMDGWGGQHPFGLGIPIIVPVTTVPDGWPREDRPDVTFVTGGLEAAVAEAHEIAGSGGVGVGGARTIQAVLEAGLLDQLHVALVPVILGDGIPFFDQVACADPPIMSRAYPTVVGRAAARHRTCRYRVRRSTELGAQFVTLVRQRRLVVDAPVDRRATRRGRGSASGAPARSPHPADRPAGSTLASPVFSNQFSSAVDRPSKAKRSTGQRGGHPGSTGVPRSRAAAHDRSRFGPRRCRLG